ncbi:SIS domain-containing protein [Longimycelium tulufanense]|uniref:SIS domain-containing protein n=1 Tax=Longimycelium tulufanense TaxID=907463 RepID=A0A8J3FW56_9PSEU|nr:sugar isomerase domain-containing protein [Longimycelium tulufanense]GGM74209.1 SIS domain-containing protein [Longimycelium tulufanense]
MSAPGSGYGEAVRAYLQRVEQHNSTAVDRAADLLLECVRAGGCIHTGGAGHSLAAVAETFFRAGGLACIRPLYHPDLLPLHGALASTVAERRSGLAEQVLAEAAPGEHDVVVVFSSSGVNAFPVELAALARRAGHPVLAVTSPAATRAAPRRAGSTLSEQATLILDSLVPPGDVTHPAHDPVTAPISTLAVVFLWNAVLVRLIDRAAAEDVELPLWRSSNVVGNDEWNKALIARYQHRIPQL